MNFQAGNSLESWNGPSTPFIHMAKSSEKKIRKSNELVQRAMLSAFLVSNALLQFLHPMATLTRRQTVVYVVSQVLLVLTGYAVRQAAADQEWINATGVTEILLDTMLIIVASTFVAAVWSFKAFYFMLAIPALVAFKLFKGGSALQGLLGNSARKR